jgi:uncharacterized protein DUF3293
MQRPRQIPPHLLRAYCRTNYLAGGVLVRIGRRVPGELFVCLRSRTGVFITAWNPMSRRMPDGWNDRMQQRLCWHLRRRVALPAEGSLGRWREAHLLVGGDPRPVVRFARRFRQRGVVIVARGRLARLALICGARVCAAGKEAIQRWAR